tara:strand:- start:2032 stop:2202 length:171 start_codon:yes stop_codon:yes gene_type:complete
MNTYSIDLVQRIGDCKAAIDAFDDVKFDINGLEYNLLLDKTAQEHGFVDYEDFYWA